MKKTAKIIAFLLSLVMVIGVASAYVINASAAGDPSFNMVKTGESGNKVTVAVNLTSGSFNAMDFQFTTSSGVKCESISATGGYGNKNNGMVSMASVDGYTGGTVITATFTVPSEGDYSISGSVTDCTISEGGVNRAAKASMSGSVSGTKTTNTTATTKPTTATTKPTTTTTKTTTSTTKPTATKKGQTTKATVKKGDKTAATLPTTKIDDKDLKTKTDASDVSDESLTDELITEPLDGIVEANQDYTYATEGTSAEEQEEEGKALNPKLIGIIGGAAAVLVGGAAAAIIITNKKKNDEDDYE